MCVCVCVSVFASVRKKIIQLRSTAQKKKSIIFFLFNRMVSSRKEKQDLRGRHGKIETRETNSVFFILFLLRCVIYIHDG